MPPPNGCQEGYRQALEPFGGFAALRVAGGFQLAHPLNQGGMSGMFRAGTGGVGVCPEFKCRLKPAMPIDLTLLSSHLLKWTHVQYIIASGMGALMQVFERLRKCRFCGTDMTDAVSPESYAANPFCDRCFRRRVREASDRLGAFDVVRVGTYLAIRPGPQRAPSG